MSTPASPHVQHIIGPLVTLEVHELLLTARADMRETLACSLDLSRSQTSVQIFADRWSWQGASFPFLEVCKPRTIYYWNGESFAPVARFSNSLLKLVPTDWGPPTFEIDGIKMLPTAQVSPFDDAREKVDLIAPRGKSVLDTCGGLGYFAAWCLERGAARIASFEKNPDVLWLRRFNPWSPASDEDRDSRYQLEVDDVSTAIARLPANEFDAVLHDPPRFAIAGELYSQAFYDELARVLRRNGKLFHYTGTPNKLTTGRDVPQEVANRLKRAGFATEPKLDGVLAVKKSGRVSR